jgi:hypothetical protein
MGDTQTLPGPVSWRRDLVTLGAGPADFVSVGYCPEILDGT